MYSGLKAYTQTEVTTSDPKKLILLLYDACLKHLLQTREAMLQKDAKSRGEHLGKAIEIINELINSLRDDPKDEAVQFLHGLYTAIIKELGKAGFKNDVSTVNLSIKYIAQLRRIWIDHVMKEDRPSASTNESKAASRKKIDVYDKSTTTSVKAAAGV